MSTLDIIKVHVPETLMPDHLIENGFSSQVVDDLMQYAEQLWGNIRRYLDQSRLSAEDFRLILSGLAQDLSECKLVQDAIMTRRQLEVLPNNIQGKLDTLRDSFSFLAPEIGYIAQLCDFNLGVKLSQKLSAGLSHEIEISALGASSVTGGTEEPMTGDKLRKKELDLLSRCNSFNKKLESWLDLAWQMSRYVERSDSQEYLRFREFISSMESGRRSFICAARRNDTRNVLFLLEGFADQIITIFNNPITLTAKSQTGSIHTIAYTSTLGNCL